MSNPVRAQKRRGSISNSGEVINNDRVGRAGGGSGIGPVLVPPTTLRFSKRGYIPIIILLISGIIIMSALKRLGVLHITIGRRKSRCLGFCGQNDPKYVVAVI